MFGSFELKGNERADTEMRAPNVVNWIDDAYKLEKMGLISLAYSVRTKLAEAANLRITALRLRAFFMNVFHLLRWCQLNSPTGQKNRNSTDQ